MGLADTVKSLENQFSQVIPQDQHLVIRLDGRSFHRWTKSFDKPFDSLIELSIESAMRRVGLAYGADFGYAQSDEITLCWTAHPKRQHPFGGKCNKINSFMPSEIGAEFNRCIHQYGKSQVSDATFDCRTFAANTASELYAIFKWRYDDAIRNGINSVAHHYFSNAALDGLSSQERLDLPGHEYQQALRSRSKFATRGSFVVKKTCFEPLPEDHPGRAYTSDPVERSYYESTEPVDFFAHIKTVEP